MTPDLRDRGVFRVQLVCPEKLERGGATERTELAGCQEKEAQRATVGLMASPDFQERKGTEGNKDRPDPQDLPEKMGQGEKMDQLDKEEWLERVVLVVCLAREELQVLQASAVFQDWTGSRVPKETWDLKESQVLQDSRACLDPMVSLVLRVRSVPLARKVLKVNRAWLGSLAPMANRGILEKKVQLERKVLRVILDLLERSATPDLAESKAQRASVDSKVAKERREKMDSLASKGTWV